MPPKRLSIVIPAKNEAESLPHTLRNIQSVMERHQIEHEIVVVDDGSSDETWQVLADLSTEIPSLAAVQNRGKHGFGRAIICGLDHYTGDAVIIMMADESDDPEDAVLYWRQIQKGAEAVFGSRFIKGGKVYDYPSHKLLVNRAANLFIRLLFNIRLNDTTNAFKAYRREVIDGCRPFLSAHFNLTVELPLKAIVRGYKWQMIPITWRNRRFGVAKLKIQEMGSRYLFICLYCWLEKYFSRGDYKRQLEETPITTAHHAAPTNIQESRHAEQPKKSSAEKTSAKI